MSIGPLAYRLLLTFGGSDPTGLTLRFLHAVAQVTDWSELRVIVGPGYSDQRRAYTQVIMSKSHHTYELAFTGTPTLLI